MDIRTDDMHLIVGCWYYWHTEDMMGKLEVKVLTLEEILYYGGLGEVEIKSSEDWEHFTESVRVSLEQEYDRGYEDCMDTQ